MWQIDFNLIFSSIICLLIISNAENCDKKFERICYYSSWSGPLNNMYSQPELCTVVM